MRRHTVPRARVRIPAAHGFVRPRLHALLDGIRVTRLALVVAPAGSGKTTVLANWAHRFPGVRAWYRADAVDAVRTGIAQCVLSALQQGLTQQGLPSRSADDLPAVTSDELAVEDVVGLIEDHAEPVLLVIDDVHELAETPAMPALERLLQLAPDNLSIALGTRIMPPINLARLEVPQPVLVVADDLRFRSWEVEGLFRDFYAEPLRPDDAAALARRTDGWAAGLQLFHLATLGRERDARSDAVSSLTGRSRYAQDYLSGQVLAALPVQLREFVRRTCVFDTLTGARCDELLEQEHSQRSLEELERRQALTTSDDDGATFRYHEVFRRHLATALLEEVGDDGMRDWYGRAAEILEAEGAVVEALRARCRGADWTGVQRLLHDDGAQIAAAQDSDWAELLPPWLTQGDPWVALAEARHLLDDGQLVPAETAARRALDLFTDHLGKDLCRAVIHTAVTWRSGPHRAGRTWADELRSATQRAPADYALGNLHDGHAELVTGLASLLSGDALRGGAALGGLADGSARDAQLALTARLVLAGFGAVLQLRPDAVSELEQLSSDAEKNGHTWITRIARGLLLAAEGTSEGVTSADELAQACALRDDPWAAALLRAGVALSLLRRGALEVDRLDALIGDLRVLDAGVLEAWARAARAYVIAVGEHPEAEQEIRGAESFVRSAGVPAALSLVYAALAELRPAESAELLELARSTAEAAGLAAAPWQWQRHVSVVTPTDSAIVQVDCFTALRIEIDGREWVPSGVRPRARTLLRLMSLQAGQPIHRERLAEYLWADMSADAAMHNLQVTISSLRKTLAQNAPTLSIVRDGDAYRLEFGSGVRSDVRSFDKHLAHAARARVAGDLDGAARGLQQALDHYTGDLLTEEGAAEWVLEPRERYRMLAAGAAASLAELELTRDDPAAAAVAAARAVQIDRHNDGAWRALIRAHEQRGDLASAEQAQRGYRTMLDSLDL